MGCIFAYVALNGSFQVKTDLKMVTLAWYDGVVNPLHVIIQYNECCLLFQWNIYTILNIQKT